MIGLQSPKPRRAALLAVLLASGFLVGAPVTQPVSAQQAFTEDGQNIKGPNVTVVHTTATWFTQIGPDRWQALNRTDRSTEELRETMRDEWSVYLVDTDGREYQFDLYRRMVSLKPSGLAKTDLGVITAASKRPLQRTVLPSPPTPPPPPPAPPPPPVPPPPPADAFEDEEEIGLTEYAGYACEGNPGFNIQQVEGGGWQQLDQNGRAIADLAVLSKTSEELTFMSIAGRRSGTLRFFVHPGNRTVHQEDLARRGARTLLCATLEPTRATAVVKQPLFTPPVPVDPVPNWQKGGVLASNFYEAWNRPFSKHGLKIENVGSSALPIIGHIQGMANRWTSQGDRVYAFVSDRPAYSSYLLTLCHSSRCYEYLLGTDGHPGGGIQMLGTVLISSDEDDRTHFYENGDITRPPRKLACSIPDHGGTAGLTWDRTNQVHVATIGNGGQRRIYVSNGNDLDSPRCKFTRVTKSDGDPVNQFLGTPGEGFSQLFWDGSNRRIVAIGDADDSDRIYYQTFSLRKRDGEWWATVGERSSAKELALDINTPSLRWGGTIVMSGGGFDLIVSPRNPNPALIGRSNLPTTVFRAR